MRRTQKPSAKSCCVSANIWKEEIDFIRFASLIINRFYQLARAIAMQFRVRGGPKLTSRYKIIFGVSGRKRSLADERHVSRRGNNYNPISVDCHLRPFASLKEARFKEKLVRGGGETRRRQIIVYLQLLYTSTIIACRLPCLYVCREFAGFRGGIGRARLSGANNLLH